MTKTENVMNWLSWQMLKLFYPKEAKKLLKAEIKRRNL